MADEFDLRDEDRLPWLETVEPDEPPRRRWGTLVAGALVTLAAVVGIVLGVREWRGHGAAGNGELIQAQAGDYKVRPDDPGGLKVAGEGDAAIAASAGKGAGQGAIDLKAVPERPVAGHRAAASAAEPPAGRSAVAAVPAHGAPLTAAAPAAAPPAAAPAPRGGALVQLGAYPSEGAANAAWGSFARRFGYLAPLGKSVQPVAVGGHTFYRLRVNAGSADQAAELCGRLKVAGEACFVAS